LFEEAKAFLMFEEAKAFLTGDRRYPRDSPGCESLDDMENDRSPP
jgi:hypothetical protein